MIKFFRNIRKKLASENKVAGYLRYAIGEIVLVMIGILLALQINNWNEARKERNNEIKYLKNLKLDLKTDLVNLDLMIVDRRNKMSSANTLLELKPPATMEELTVFDSLLWNVYGWASFTPRTITINELISSGNFNIIKNDSIKSYLMSIKEINEVIVIRREHMRREYDNYLYDRTWPILEIRPFWDLEKSIKQKKRINIEISDDKRQQIASQAAIFLKDMTIRNGLKLAAMNNFGILNRYESLYAEIEKLIKFIDEDINEKP
ncbi:MAG: hypothetical protein IPH11_13365 [Ignavibacteriales bacterium]|nr:hypothetical protein [Ignavibacteriales bacterium]